LKKNKKRHRSSSSILKRGNITLIRLLVLVNSAGPSGISTMKLFRELGTTGYGQTTLSRALREGLIERVKGEPPAPGQFSPVYNIITKPGKQLLQNHHQLLY
jgi:hypothetical protein